MDRGRKAGFTLIEVLFAMALVCIVVAKVTMLLNSAQNANTKQSAAMALEDQARRVLDQIAYAVMSADRETLLPGQESPLYSPNVRYQISLGVEDGEVVWGDLEEISEDGSQVVWRQNPGAPEERRVAWCNVVRQLLEGEVVNGVDDNGNGLVDETGLSFTLDRDAVWIRLCLERMNKDGTAATETVETLVTCRN